MKAPVGLRDAEPEPPRTTRKRPNPPAPPTAPAEAAPPAPAVESDAERDLMLATLLQEATNEGAFWQARAEEWEQKHLRARSAVVEHEQTLATLNAQLQIQTAHIAALERQLPA